MEDSLKGSWNGSEKVSQGLFQGEKVRRRRSQNAHALNLEVSDLLFLLFVGRGQWGDGGQECVGAGGRSKHCFEGRNAKLRNAHLASDILSEVLLA